MILMGICATPDTANSAQLQSAERRATPLITRRTGVDALITSTLGTGSVHFISSASHGSSGSGVPASRTSEPPSMRIQNWKPASSPCACMVRQSDER